MDNTTFDNLQNNMMSRDFLAQNPVVDALKQGKMTTEGALEAVQNYCVLAAEITRLLWRAMASAEEECMEATVSELLRNISEEQGSRTEGMSHYHILVNGLHKELGIRGHVFTRRTSTTDLLEGTYQQYSVSTAHMLGAAYALEASATPELFVVGGILNLFAKATGQKLPISRATLRGEVDSNNTDWNLDRFLSMHVADFEPGHEDGLRTALKKELDDDQQVAFEKGFMTVMDLMEDWWRDLATC